ncbi:2-succinyl-5-enolpyruvyl-6-hydroxy-3-cyclohexene-1-carboxylic-acid synthase [Pararhodonellum marinum]|uniref:2-succinyl-5-enolpyruvyl-6-hydroxy-3- cyclohexene-1-carboxylic-acid synthase n=1 Tax=Pararhodonellum marinum TaxID=2755358 RepID=UPI00188FB2D3|nr:2-succinyl-5-enolpyruvyl-6-hydroxy-3-cyclohexene-1-carboxylic-acid synthase [Pararhodonellum marinum]
MILQPLLDLAATCAQYGIKHAILSPGSRCAPITLAFVRHPEIQCKTISDERSAAFIALGMAQQLEKPVVLVCTSGSAALNYAPAVAEAYFQQIPLLVLTADRPPEWIDQWDGQTIRQHNLYGTHVKNSFQFPDDFGHPDKAWHAKRIVNEAILSATAYPQGPVHINIPLREPFYPEKDQIFQYPSLTSTMDHLEKASSLTSETWIKIRSALSKYNKILIVPGQQRPNEAIQEQLQQLTIKKAAVVVTDVISNLQAEGTISFHDHFLPVDVVEKKMAPDLIISFGKSVISKNLKLFLRKSDAMHWHLQPEGYVPDTFKRGVQTLACEPLMFLEFLNKEDKISNEEFVQVWSVREEQVKYKLPSLLKNTDFGEYTAFSACFDQIPSDAKVHLANSMAVRYANLLGPRKQEIICNRGTSGIDGSNSTAVGCAFTTKDPVVLMTGDMAFFYDRNAFWHNYALPNLRIIVFNNHGGGIFRMINGPDKLPELEEYFETKQLLNAGHLAKEYGFDYHLVDEKTELDQVLSHFFQKTLKPKILEIKSESQKNEQFFKEIKSKINKF